MEVSAELSTNEMDESRRRHRDSASTLGLNSSSWSAVSRNGMEMQGTSEDPPSLEPLVPTVAMTESAGEDKQGVEKSSDVSANVSCKY